MTELALPKIDKKIIDRKDEIVKNLSKIFFNSAWTCSFISEY